MSQKIVWRMSNFKPGMHVAQSTTEAPDQFLYNLENLRVDADGFVRTRFGHSVEVDTTNLVTGLVSVADESGNEITLLLDDQDDLKIFLNGIGGTLTTLVNDSAFAGRLSAAFVIKDVVFVTSEGTDRGYWVDLSNYPTSAAAYPIGFDRHNVQGVTNVSSLGGLGGPAPGTYFYILTLFRSAEPLNNSEGIRSLFMKAVVSAGHDRMTVGSGNTIPTLTLAATGADEKLLYRSAMISTVSPVPTASLTTNQWVLADTAANFSSVTAGQYVMNLTDESEMKIDKVYKTSLYSDDGLYGGTANTWTSGDQYEIVPAALDMKLVDRLSIGTTIYVDDVAEADRGSAWDADADVRRGRAPANIKSIAWYNDRVWLAGYGAGIRYSHINDGNPEYLSFPAGNEILSLRGDIEMVAAFKEILVTGGPRALGRLTGFSEFDFDVDWLDDRGPINTHTWCVHDDIIAFIAPAGFFLFDGTRSVEFGQQVIQLFAEETNFPMFEAACTYLPTQEFLFDIVDESQNTHTQLVYNLREGSWRRNVGADAEQYITVRVGHESRVYYAWADDNYIRRYWHGLEESAGMPSLGSDEITGPSTPTTSSINWKMRTQRLDWRGQGLAGTRKLIRSVNVLATQTSEVVTFEHFIDGSSVETDASVTTSRSAQRPYKLALERRGYDYQVELRGDGDDQFELVEIEGTAQ